MPDTPVSTIHVHVMDTFSTSLASNPSTGYQWMLSNPPDPRFLSLLETTYLPPSAPTARVGHSGRQIWKFQALKQGLTTLSFKYCRPWDESDCAQFHFYLIAIR
ncbi:protease inhibitor I42 family protein [Brevibacillus panacihumi]|uniref:protease inhibitor I42 family protein n=1 Tax=Brevibacillus panacihumi TaxID=497735 RepID=UPI003D1B219D